MNISMVKLAKEVKVVGPEYESLSSLSGLFKILLTCYQDEHDNKREVRFNGLVSTSNHCSTNAGSYVTTPSNQNIRK